MTSAVSWPAQERLKDDSILAQALIANPTALFATPQTVVLQLHDGSFPFRWKDNDPVYL